MFAWCAKTNEVHSHVTQHIWAFARTNEVHSHVIQHVWVSTRTNEVHSHVKRHIWDSARTNDVHSRVTQHVWASARTNEVHSRVTQHVWASARTNEVHSCVPIKLRFYWNIVICELTLVLCWGRFNPLWGAVESLATTFSVFQQMEWFLVTNLILTHILGKCFENFQKLNNTLWANSLPFRYVRNENIHSIKLL